MKRIISLLICAVMLTGLVSGLCMTSSAENSVKINVNVDFSIIPRDQIEDRVEAYFYWSDEPIAFTFDNGFVPEGWDMIVASTSLSDTILCAEGDIHPANTDEYYIALVMVGHSTNNNYKNAVAYYGYNTYDMKSVKADRGALYSEPEDIIIEADADNYTDEFGNWSYNMLAKTDTVSITPVSDNELLGTVSGGGDTLIGTQTTIKAEPLSGAEFTGWYDKDGNLLSTETEPELIALRDGEYYAEFNCTGVVPAELKKATSTEITIKTVKGQIYSIDNGETWTDPASKDGTYTFNGLEKDTEYQIFARSESYEATAVSTLKTALHDFTDLPSGQWYTEACEWCYKNGYMTGTSVTAFSPDLKLTRGMYVQILAKIAGADLDSYTPSGKFKDVPKEAWYAKAVEWAYRNQITGGTSDTTFSPDDYVTREQLATFFMAYARKIGLDVSKKADLSKFKDAGKISSWAKESMQFAVANKLISGTSETTLDPKAVATRAQVAVIFKSFVENLMTTETE